MKSLRFRCLILMLGSCAVLLQGCGGGGGGGIAPTPDFTLSASTTTLKLPAGSSTNLPLNTSALNGFTGNITIQATGLPAGVTTTPTLPMTLSVPGSQSVTISVLATVATGDYPITITGTSGALRHSVSGTLTIQAPLQFSLNASPTTSSVVAGSSTTFQLSMSTDNGFSDDVTIQVAGLPLGMTLSPSLPFSWNGPASQTMTVNADTTVAAGNYTLTFTGSTTSGLSHSTQETVSVQPPPPPSFTLNVSPPSLTLAAGTVGTFQISVVPANGFSGQVDVQITGLPANASLTPSSPFSIADAPQTVSLSTTMPLAAGSYPLTVQGSSGSLSATGTETLNVQTATPPPSRSDFVRTDDQPQAVAYDKLHQRIYVTNPVAGTVDAISSTTYQILRRIPVPQPYGIDITPDNSTVFIGTLSQALYAMDTATMALTARYIAPLQMPDPTSPGWLWPQTPSVPVATPDDCALISLFGLPLAHGRIVKWNPKTGQTTTVVSGAVIPLGGSQFPDGQGEPLYPSAVSADHTKAIVTNDLSSSTVYLFDTTSNTFVQNVVVPEYIDTLAANPNGTQFAAAGSLIYILDANLNTIATLPGFGRPIYSADGKYLYLSVVVEDGGIAEVWIYDTTSFNLVGTAPDFSIVISGRDPPIWPEFPLAVDETGRIFGGGYNGLAIVDTTDLRTYGNNLLVEDSNFASIPDTGPVGVAQTVTLETQVYDAIPSVWFGALPASNTSINNVYLSTVAPASSQGGIVNIRIESPDNVQAWIAQGYTYGAVLLREPELAAANDGSTTIDLYGYGLDPYNSSAPATTVSFGSHEGRVTGYRNISGSVPPYDLGVRTPQMPIGESDVTATSASGSSTLHSIFHAVEVHTSPLDGTGASIAYDARRKQIYVATSDHVDVYSLASNSFIATFAIPTLNGLKNLGGMAVTPDGKWLIVTNSTDASVAVIDPDNPSGATAVAVGTTTPGNGPSQAAATNTSQALLMTNLDGIWILDLNTMTAAQTKDLTLNGNSVAASPDGSKVCVAYLPNGPLGLYDSASGMVTLGPQRSANGNATGMCGVNGGVVVSTSVSGNVVAMASNLKLVPVTTGSLTLYEFLELRQGGGNLVGLAAGNTGALTYMLYGDKIVLFDAHNGDYRERVALPDMSQPLQTYQLNALAINETGDQMYAITAGGLTTVQLDSLPLAIGGITVSGGAWNVAGTGFVAGTGVAVDGKSLSVTFTDSQHIQVAGAPALGTSHTIKLTNPDGHTYTYDAAYFR